MACPQPIVSADGSPKSLRCEVQPYDRAAGGADWADARRVNSGSEGREAARGPAGGRPGTWEGWRDSGSGMTAHVAEGEVRGDYRVCSRASEMLAWPEEGRRTWTWTWTCK